MTKELTTAEVASLCAMTMVGMMGVRVDAEAFGLRGMHKSKAETNCEAEGEGSSEELEVGNLTIGDSKPPPPADAADAADAATDADGTPAAAAPATSAREKAMECNPLLAVFNNWNMITPHICRHRYVQCAPSLSLSHTHTRTHTNIHPSLATH